MTLTLFKKHRYQSQEAGFILPVLLVTGVMIVLMIIAVSSATVTNQNISVKGNHRINAQLAADAGLDDAINKINTVENWDGTGGEITLLDDPAQNIKTTYDVVVTNGSDSSKKTLTVTAKTYSPTTAATPQATRKYNLDIQAVTSGTGAASVSSGVGGLILSNNAKISGGDVVVNGKIAMSNNSQIGLSTNSVNVRAAHQSCPVPADVTYPQICGPGNGEPIVMSNSAKIYANVQATNQVTSANMSNPGLIAGSSFTPVALPSFDRTGFKNTVNTSGQTMTSSAAATCSGNQVNWPANVKITGNVNVSGNCTAKINGNVWITGNLTISNNAKLAIQDGVGTTMPNIVVDGSSGVNISNNASVTPNASTTGAQFLTFWSAAACSPDCSDVTGIDLYNSQNALTINLNNNGSASNSVLYSYWSKVQISNNGAIGAVAGQTVELSNNAVINFTASIPGSDNLTTTWVKRGYMRVYE